MAFLDNAGVFTTIDVPGAVGLTYAYGINKQGAIVGAYLNSHGYYSGYLNDRGVFTSFDVPFPSVVSTVAYGINDRG
jgi:hypothetical protein